MNKSKIDCKNRILIASFLPLKAIILSLLMLSNAGANSICRFAVVDSSARPVSNAYVSFDGSEKKTDSRGNTEFACRSRKRTLFSVQKEGCKPIQRRYTVPNLVINDIKVSIPISACTGYRPYIGWNYRPDKFEIERLNLNQTEGRPSLLTMKNIWINPSVSVRSDNRACVSCHTDHENFDKNDACNKVDSFMQYPGKPQPVRVLLWEWKNRGCPN